MHLIHKHIFDIDVERKDLAYQIHNRLSDVMNTSFYPKAELLLDQYDLVNETISFDKLYFDLKTIPQRNWQDHLVDAMLLQFERFLQEHITMKKQKAEDHQEVTAAKNQVVLEELLFTFIRSGSLPVNPLVKNLYELEQNLVFHSAWWSQLVSLLKEDDRYWKRFLFNLSEPFLEKCLNFLYASEITMRSEIDGFVEPWKELTSVHRRTALVIPLFLSFFHQEYASAHRWAKKFIDMLINECSLIPNQSWFTTLDKLHYSEKEESLGERTWSNPLLLNIIDELDQLRKSFQRTTDFSEIRTDNRKITDVIESHHEASRLKERQEISYFVDNAGLVLLHPFLPTLFKKLDYVDDQGLLLNEHVHQACSILQYAAIGEDRFTENDLLLNKILCGLDSSSLITTHLPLSPTEMNVMQDLLTALIDHWKILKNTSVDGLRNTFIKRSGKLIIREDYDELLVENNAVDILLDGLPWGISFIQLPWMLKPLHVFWQTN